MFLLAEQIDRRDATLASRLLEEARWGLYWILKNRFGDGYRATWGTMDFWTDNLIGTTDDMLAGRVRNDAYHNFHSVTAEAIGARLLRQDYPYLAARSLKYAREDWRFAIEQLRRARLETHAIGAVASVKLFASYLKKVAEYTATSGDIVGGLPVGIQTSRNDDQPFWPADNCYNFKEIWVHPSSRWLSILADLEAIKNGR
jgi:hypothetical protein